MAFSPKRNQINPNKLLLSKWTATEPINKRKHFIIIELLRDPDTEEVTGCMIEAVIDKYKMQIDWKDLKNAEVWRLGWK
ncbi:TIGR02450 family Trp-rich protein [Neptuniibacter sp. QD48_11]|uniref:TIGR02450 family Trp-rich protein n=1 Tax=unclassified Neptuniibacter TaxID=2630693 RepID=UPI0039F531FC